jgi:hypothetical protein
MTFFLALSIGIALYALAGFADRKLGLWGDCE